MGLARFLGTVAILLISAAVVLPAPEPFPLDELRPGMWGTAYTVFQGDSVLGFPVEILDRLPGRGPFELILVRGDDELMERGGICQGMSGSPVYIDGRWLGAIAYSFGFSREALGVVTPAAAMLALSERPGKEMGDAGGALRHLPFLLDPEHSQAALAGKPPVAGGQALSISISGLDPVALARLEEQLGQPGLALLPMGGRSLASTPALGFGGGAATGAGSLAGADELPTPVPGAAVAAELMRGPISAAVIGTLSHVDGDRVWAFGHSFLDEGSIELPLALVRVHAIMPSLLTSFKIGSVTEPIGTLLREGRAGVFGRLGPAPDLLPLRIESLGSPPLMPVARFEIVRHRRLLPILARSALQAWMQGTLGASQRGQLRLDCIIYPAASVAAARRNVTPEQPGEAPFLVVAESFAGEGALVSAGAWLQTLLDVLEQNPAGPLPIDSLALRVEWREGVEATELLSLAVDKAAIRSGEDWRLRLRFAQGERETPVDAWSFPSRVDSPDGSINYSRLLPPGEYRLHVADGLSFHVWDAKRQPELYAIRDHASLLALLAGLESSSDWVIWLEEPGSDRVLGGREMTLPGYFRALLPESAGSAPEKPRRLLARLSHSYGTSGGVPGHLSIPVTILPHPARSIR